MSHPLFDLANRVALVSGAASGLGRATALRLGRAGAKVIIADLNEEGGQETAAELGESGVFCKVNVADEADVNAALDLAETTFGGTVNVAVNCAGIAIAKRVLGRDGSPHALDAFEKILHVNIGGTFNIIRLCAARMAQSEPNAEGERGVIINTASVAAYDGQIGQAAYSSSKGGVVGLTLPAARELAQFGVRVLTIAPGLVETPMLLGLPPEVQKSLGDSVPFPKRLGRPEEFAKLALHMVDNTMLNGEVVRLDGAIRLAPR